MIASAKVRCNFGNFGGFLSRIHIMRISLMVLISFWTSFDSIFCFSILVLNLHIDFFSVFLCISLWSLRLPPTNCISCASFMALCLWSLQRRFWIWTTLWDPTIHGQFDWIYIAHNIKDLSLPLTEMSSSLFANVALTNLEPERFQPLVVLQHMTANCQRSVLANIRLAMKLCVSSSCHRQPTSPKWGHLQSEFVALLRWIRAGQHCDHPWSIDNPAN